jgi:hypothetical protein
MAEEVLSARICCHSMEQQRKISCLCPSIFDRQRIHEILDMALDHIDVADDLSAEVRTNSTSLFLPGCTIGR